MKQVIVEVDLESRALGGGNKRRGRAHRISEKTRISRAEAAY